MSGSSNLYSFRDGRAGGRIVGACGVLPQDLFNIALAGICLFVWVLRYINLFRLFNAKSIFIQMNGFISNNSV